MKNHSSGRENSWMRLSSTDGRGKDRENHGKADYFARKFRQRKNFHVKGLAENVWTQYDGNLLGCRAREMLWIKEGNGTKALPLLANLLEYGRKNSEITISIRMSMLSDNKWKVIEMYFIKEYN